MELPELRSKLRHLRQSRGREIFVIVGDANLIYPVDDIYEARSAEFDEDGTKEAIEASGIPNNAIIIRV